MRVSSGNGGRGPSASLASLHIEHSSQPVIRPKTYSDQRENYIGAYVECSKEIDVSNIIMPPVPASLVQHQ